ncbi:hypothetical protein T492DRAFT_274334 [Pavlovales sp. CCMP2436]|nr:hypothetical protein T492DRAFT_274334 [Pavlovales sp. CCMP2436]
MEAVEVAEAVEAVRKANFRETWRADEALRAEEALRKEAMRKAEARALVLQRRGVFTSLVIDVESRTRRDCTGRSLGEQKEDACYKFVVDKVLSDMCPGCSRVHDNFEGCTALTCSDEACETIFCAYCLLDCGKGQAGWDAAHAHVKDCDSGRG